MLKDYTKKIVKTTPAPAPKNIQAPEPTKQEITAYMKKTGQGYVQAQKDLIRKRLNK